MGSVRLVSAATAQSAKEGSVGVEALVERGEDERHSARRMGGRVVCVGVPLSSKERAHAQLLEVLISSPLKDANAGLQRAEPETGVGALN